MSLDIFYSQTYDWSKMSAGKLFQMTGAGNENSVQQNVWLTYEQSVKVAQQNALDRWHIMAFIVGDVTLTLTRVICSLKHSRTVTLKKLSRKRL